MANLERLIKACILLAALRLAANATTVFGMDVQRLQLATGQMRALQFPEGADLGVSRRGVVDVFHAGNGVWQITALRAGFVIIDSQISNDESATTAGRVLVTVVNSALASDKSSPHQPTHSGLPNALCRPKSVFCDNDARTVAGVAPDFRWYEAALRACRGGEFCRVDAELAPSSRQAWALSVQRALGRDYSVHAESGDVGALRADTSCGKEGRGRRRETADALTAGAVSDGAIVILCREDAGSDRYTLNARVFLVEHSAASQLGFDGTSQLTLQASPGAAAAEAALLQKLRALQAERRAEIVGEPVFRLVANEPAHILTGGEFQVIASSDDRETAPRTEWKKHGLELSVTAKPLNAGKVRLSYELTLSSRADEKAALAVNSVTSVVDLPLGAAVVASVLDLDSSGRRSNETPGLAGLPVIGPLFRLKAAERATSRMIVWLELSEDSGGGDL